jgi:glutaredoxin
VLPHVKDKGWSPQLVEDVLKDIILRDSQNRRRLANRITKATGGVVKRGRQRTLREGETEFSTPNPSTVIPMADPNYVQARTLLTRSAVPSQGQGQMVASSDATEQSQIIVASQSRKRAGAAPIEGSDIATISAPKKAKTQKRLQQQQSTAGIVKHKKAKHTKAKQKPRLESPYIFINNAYIVLQQSLSFRKWSRILDENSAVEDIRRKPIYFYRRLDGSVGTVSDAEEYQAFLGEFRNCLLLKDAQGAIKIDRVRHVVRVSYSILPASFHVTDDGYTICPQAFMPPTMVTCHRRWLHHFARKLLYPP